MVKYFFEDNLISFTLPPSHEDLFVSRASDSEGNLLVSRGEAGEFISSVFNIRVVTTILKGMKLEVDTSELFDKVGRTEFEDLGQSYLRAEQYEYVRIIQQYWSGLISLPTGYGKGTMITYLVNSSLSRGNNILICAPNYSIVDELNSRLLKYDVQCSKEFDINSRVWLINPVGFMARNSKMNYSDWFSKVDMLIVDECDAVTNSLSELIDTQLTNCKYRYGFSATPDKKQGTLLQGLDNLSGIDPTTAKVLKYFGFSIVYRRSQKQIRLVNTPLNCGDYQNLYSYDKCVNQVTHSKHFVRYIKLCIEDNNRYHNSCILLPFTNRNHVRYLLTSPELSKYNIAMWTANGIDWNGGRGWESGGLEEVKTKVNNHEIDLLMTSSVGFKGVDITGLRSVIFITGSSYGLVTQILGRVFRYSGVEVPTVYLLDNISLNPLYNAARRRRLEYISMNPHSVENLSLWGLEGFDAFPV